MLLDWLGYVAFGLGMGLLGYGLAHRPVRRHQHVWSRWQRDTATALHQRRSCESCGWTEMRGML
jgi:hypothetical protein